VRTSSACALGLLLVASLALAGGGSDKPWALLVAPPDAGWRHVSLERDGGCPSGPEYACVCAYRLLRHREGCVIEVCETSNSWHRAVVIPRDPRDPNSVEGGRLENAIGDSLCHTSPDERRFFPFGHRMRHDTEA